MKVAILGGSGLLGLELTKRLSQQGIDFLSPTSDEIDVRDKTKVHCFISEHQPDVLIHCAAITDNRVIERDPHEAIQVNIMASAFIASLCHKYNVRMVYISTDYLYEGVRGNHSESDPLKPFNQYAWTKLGGECAVHLVKNHLIIRTTFGHKHQYSKAFTDKYASKLDVTEAAKMILEASLSHLTGVLNIGSERRSIADWATSVGATFEPIKLKDASYNTPVDTSMNIQRWKDFKTEKPVYKLHTACRCCGGSLTKYLDLGLMPMANGLKHDKESAKNAERYPLQVMLCEKCGLSQLSVVVDPKVLYDYYTYRSSINAGYVQHAYDMCLELQKRHMKDRGNSHIDIAGNDGTLLKQAVKAYKTWGIDGYDTLNIDPAKNLCEIARADGIDSLSRFWSIDVANLNEGDATLITATNVFAHVDNIKEFLVAAKIALRIDGVLVLEFPYLIDFIDNFEWETTYHEHLSYMSITPIAMLCDQIGLEIINAEKQEIHGGTMRVTIANKEQFVPWPQIQKLLDIEIFNYQSIEKYKEWTLEVEKTIRTFGNRILQLKKEGAKIGAFGASAKGNTLFNACGITTDLIDWIADETPEKIGKFAPGCAIPIVKIEQIMKDNPDYIVVLSWNFREAIAYKIRGLGYKGKFIVSTPHFEIFN